MRKVVPLTVFALCAIGAWAADSALPSQDPYVVGGPEKGPPPGRGADRGGGRGGNVAAMVDRLDQALALTADQKKEVTAIYEKYMAAMNPPGRGGRARGGQPANKAGDGAKKDASPPNPADAQKKIRDEIRAILTPEQLKKFDAMPADGRGGQGGRGGPGGPGRGGAGRAGQAKKA